MERIGSSNQEDRMRARVLALAIAMASLALAAAASAHDGPHDGDAAAAHAQAAGAAQQPAAPAGDRDADARAELADAKRRLEQAETAHTRMLTRNFPRGGARAKIEKERDDARADWQRLAAARPDLARQLEAGASAN
jgi:hypothetical protein